MDWAHVIGVAGFCTGLVALWESWRIHDKLLGRINDLQNQISRLSARTPRRYG